jgi:hypothetical protein
MFWSLLAWEPLVWLMLLVFVVAAALRELIRGLFRDRAHKRLIDAGYVPRQWEGGWSDVVPSDCHERSMAVLTRGENASPDRSDSSP